MVNFGEKNDSTESDKKTDEMAEERTQCADGSSEAPMSDPLLSVEIYGSPSFECASGGAVINTTADHNADHKVTATLSDYLMDTEKVQEARVADAIERSLKPRLSPSEAELSIYSDDQMNEIDGECRIVDRCAYEHIQHKLTLHRDYVRKLPASKLIVEGDVDKSVDASESAYEFMKEDSKTEENSKMSPSATFHENGAIESDQQRTDAHRVSSDYIFLKNEAKKTSSAAEQSKSTVKAVRSSYEFHKDPSASVHHPKPKKQVSVYAFEAMSMADMQAAVERITSRARETYEDEGRTEAATC